MDEQIVSVICCYNNEEVLHDMLYKSISTQSIKCEFIPIDNRSNKFTSAASALNYGASISKGKYLIFAHQDIEIFDKTSLESIIKYLDELSPAIIGYAGRSKEDSAVYTNMKHGINRTYAGNKRIVVPTEVHTLDESFVAIEKSLFFKYKFDESVCDNWHLYTVDLCLLLASDNIKSYAIPSSAYHKSSGVIDKGYYKTLDKLVKKHRKNHNVIYSTCSIIKRTGSVNYLASRMKRNIKQVIRKLFFT